MYSFYKKSSFYFCSPPFRGHNEQPRHKRIGHFNTSNRPCRAEPRIAVAAVVHDNHRRGGSESYAWITQWILRQAAACCSSTSSSLPYYRSHPLLPAGVTHDLFSSPLYAPASIQNLIKHKKKIWREKSETKKEREERSSSTAKEEGERSSE
ncbi:hypothetical protein QOT17_022201 [Balamuthia mandrillaris]